MKNKCTLKELEKWVTQGAVEKSAALNCSDCDEAAKHAYSDATTPGFFSAKCPKHRAAPEEKQPGSGESKKENA